MLIDAGNSRLKWSIKTTVGEWSSVSYVCYSVSTRLAVTLKLLATMRPRFIVLTHVLGDEFASGVQVFCERQSITLDIVNAQAVGYGVTSAYPDASKLGADRFVGLIAVYHQNKRNKKHSDSIIVSCGTAVTIDAMNKYGKHLGGVILPGLKLWQDMLIKGTVLLKQSDTSNIHLFATSTGQGIAAGSLYGLAGAIDRVCNEMKLTLSKPISLILTGGCAEPLRPYLNNTYKLNANLVIQGLKTITEIDNA